MNKILNNRYGTNFFPALFLAFIIFFDTQSEAAGRCSDLTNGLVTDCPVFENGGIARSYVSPSEFSGNTIVGATRDGNIWSVYFGIDGSAEFLYSSGSRRFVNWKKRSSSIFCFDFSESYEYETCKRVSSAGRGLHWKTIGRKKSSSEILFVFVGKRLVKDNNYINDINKLKGKTIVGRTLRTKKIWYMYFDGDEEFKLYKTSGSNSTGSYYIDDDALCFEFYNTSGTHECRYINYDANAPLWVDTDTNSAYSEIVLVM